jgi:hypothetical protein
MPLLHWRSCPRKNKGRFRGADTPELFAMLRQHLPEDRILTFAKHGPPLSLEEWERRDVEIVGRKRDVMKALRSLSVLSLVFGLIAVIIGRDAIGLPGIAVMYAPMCVGGYIFVRKDLTRLERQYAQWRNQLTSDVSRTEEAPDGDQGLACELLH